MEEAFSLQDFMWIRAQFQVVVVPPLYMASPFRRKSKERKSSKKEDDTDLEEVIEAEEPLEENVAEVLESLDLEQALFESAKRVTHTCMDIRRGENVLIVCDPTTGEIGQALHRSATERSDRVLLIVMPKGRHHGEEPPAPVANLMKQQQIVIAPTKYSLTHTRSIRAALKDGARVATMPGMTDEMFISGGMTADFNQIKKSLSDISSTLRRKKLIHVKDSKGTDVEFEVSWKDWNLDDNGICNRPRMITNLPAGKAFVLPKEGTMNGTIVIDGTWESTLLEDPLELIVENGIVIDIKGDATAAQIRQQFGEAASRLRSKDRELVWTVAEFGFGMNPRAKIIGNSLEDLVSRGAIYFGFGNNMALGGTVNIPLHIRGVCRKATVALEDVDLLVEGKVTVKVR